MPESQSNGDLLPYVHSAYTRPSLFMICARRPDEIVARHVSFSPRSVFSTGYNTHTQRTYYAHHKRAPNKQRQTHTDTHTQPRVECKRNAPGSRPVNDNLSWLPTSRCVRVCRMCVCVGGCVPDSTYYKSGNAVNPRRNFCLRQGCQSSRDFHFARLEDLNRYNGYHWVLGVLLWRSSVGHQTACCHIICQRILMRAKPSIFVRNCGFCPLTQ